MRRYILARVAQGIVVAIAVAALTFFLVKVAPGDPFAEAMNDPGVSAAIRDQWRAAWGLDRSAPEQFARWTLSVARGDLGYSFSQQRPVASAIGDALPYSIVLTGAALALSVGVGVLIALIQTRSRRRWVARALDGTTLLGVAAPEAWIALLLLSTFALALPWFPAGGGLSATMRGAGPGTMIADLAWHLVLPALSLACVGSAVVARHQRAALAAAVPAAHVRAARARGLRERTIWRRHIVRNSLAPLLTLVGISLPAFAGGAVIAERVFSWPGMGLLTTHAVASRDAPLLTACVFLSAVLVVAGSLLADVLHAWIDPRVRVHERAR